MNDHVGDIDALISPPDLVLTAEGPVDYQTPRGKVPAAIARRAKRARKPVVALAGSIGKGAADVHDIGIDTIMGIMPIPWTSLEPSTRLTSWSPTRRSGRCG